MKLKLFIITGLLFPLLSAAQLMEQKDIFTKADTLRGSITKYRQGWDVLKYDLTVQPDINDKSIKGSNTITYREDVAITTMQIDLQQPLVVDSIKDQDNKNYTFSRDSNVCFVHLRDSTIKYNFLPGIKTITVFYHGCLKKRRELRGMAA
jgi:hypothetical protein